MQLSGRPSADCSLSSPLETEGGQLLNLEAQCGHRSALMQVLYKANWDVLGSRTSESYPSYICPLLLLLYVVRRHQ